MGFSLNTSYANIKILGNRIKQYRINYPLTQKELSEKSGVSLRCIQNIENGKDIQLSNFIKLLISLNLNGNLDMLIPDLSIRPSAYLNNVKIKQRVRRRITKETKDGQVFVWGDEK